MPLGVGDAQSLDAHVTPSGPRVLYRNDARRGRLVAAANASARRRGVVPAMTLSQLAAMCPEATWEEHDPNADLEELISLAEQLHEFSPIVGLEEIDRDPWSGRSLPQPQSLFLEATGIADWFGGETALAQRIQQWLAARGYVGCIGIAETVGAAWAIANYAFRSKIALAMEDLEDSRQSPRDVVWIEVLEPHVDPAAYFSEYAIESLRLDQEVVAKLHRLGIRTVGPVLRLPRSALPSRFGPALLERLDQCMGAKTEPIRAFHAGIPMAIECEWEHPVKDLEILSQHLRDQVERLCKQLMQSGHGVLRLVCRLELEKQSIAVDGVDQSRALQSHVIQLSLFQPAQDPQHLSWLLLGQLEFQPPRLGREMAFRGLRLDASITAPLQWRQNDLFEDASVQYRQQAAKLIDALSARLGRNHVVTLSAVRDPVPELQQRSRPLTGMRADGKPQDTKRKLSRAPKRNFADEHSLETRHDAFLSRPMTMIRATPIEVELDDCGAPASIAIPPNRWEVVHFSGPERIESGWWSGPSQRREYYRVALRSGDWWWVYRDLRNQAWYLHGAFA